MSDISLLKIKWSLTDTYKIQMPLTEIKIAIIMQRELLLTEGTEGLNGRAVDVESQRQVSAGIITTEPSYTGYVIFCACFFMTLNINFLSGGDIYKNG